MDEGAFVFVIMMIVAIGAIIYAFWEIVAAVLIFCAILPLLYWGVRKYIYLTNEPRIKMLIEKEDYDSALDELSQIPDAGISWLDSIRAEHLDEILEVLNNRNAELRGEVNQLKQQAEHTIFSTGTLEDRLRVVREAGQNEDFEKALIERLAHSYGMRTTRG